MAEPFYVVVAQIRAVAVSGVSVKPEISRELPRHVSPWKAA